MRRAPPAEKPNCCRRNPIFRTAGAAGARPSEKTPKSKHQAPRSPETSTTRDEAGSARSRVPKNKKYCEGVGFDLLFGSSPKGSWHGSNQIREDPAEGGLSHQPRLPLLALAPLSRSSPRRTERVNPIGHSDETGSARSRGPKNRKQETAAQRPPFLSKVRVTVNP